MSEERIVLDNELMIRGGLYGVQSRYYTACVGTHFFGCSHFPRANARTGSLDSPDHPINHWVA